jgi:hypothetical protein
MRSYTEYWTAMLVRGFLAMVTGTAILFLNCLAATVFLLPWTAVGTVLCLSAYVLLDSSVVVASSYTVPKRRPGRVALRLQGLCGVAIGVLMFSVIYDRVTTAWLLYIAAVQAAATAWGEYMAARGTSDHHRSQWCYVSSGIAAVSAVVLVALARSQQAAWAICGYLGVFGLNLVVLSAWMLFERRRVSAGAQ